jgi:hypothetical protein
MRTNLFYTDYRKSIFTGWTNFDGMNPLALNVTTSKDRHKPNLKDRTQILLTDTLFFLLLKINQLNSVMADEASCVRGCLLIDSEEEAKPLNNGELPTDALVVNAGCEGEAAPESNG